MREQTRRAPARHHSAPALLVALAVAALAVATPAAGKVIGRGEGGRNITVTAGAIAPRSVSVRVTAKPGQQVRVRASVMCSTLKSFTGFEHEAETSIKATTIAARAPLTRPLALPIKRPKSWCTVTISSTLGGTGRQSVRVLSG